MEQGASRERSRFPSTNTPRGTWCRFSGCDSKSGVLPDVRAEAKADPVDGCTAVESATRAHTGPGAQSDLLTDAPYEMTLRRCDERELLRRAGDALARRSNGYPRLAVIRRSTRGHRRRGRSRLLHGSQARPRRQAAQDRFGGRHRVIVVDHYLLWQQGPGAQITRVALLGEKCRKIRRPETMTSTEGAGYSPTADWPAGPRACAPGSGHGSGTRTQPHGACTPPGGQAPDLVRLNGLPLAGVRRPYRPSKGFGHAPGLLQQVRGSFMILPARPTGPGRERQATAAAPRSDWSTGRGLALTVATFDPIGADEDARQDQAGGWDRAARGARGHGR